MALNVDACAAQHQGDRKEQQDRVAIYPHPNRSGMLLAVLADGMGGHTGGALAAEQVVYTAKSNLEHFAPGDETPEDLLQNSMREAHTLIRASRFMNEKEPHSTAVLLLVQSSRIIWGHCGDSRLYRFRNGQFISRSVDHSYVEFLVETGRITPEQALTHSKRNVLLSCLGGKDEPKITIGETTELVGGDAYVLCSDGLWAYFDDVEFATIVAENSARDACEILIDKARRRAGGAGDNLSLAIVKLIQPPPVAKPKPPPGFIRRNV